MGNLDTALYTSNTLNYYTLAIEPYAIECYLYTKRRFFFKALAEFSTGGYQWKFEQKYRYCMSTLGLSMCSFRYGSNNTSSASTCGP